MGRFEVAPLVAEQNWQRGEDVEENSWGGVNSSKTARYFLKPIMQAETAAAVASEVAAAEAAAAETAAAEAAAALLTSDIP